MVRKWPESRENLGFCSEIGPKMVRIPRKSRIVLRNWVENGQTPEKISDCAPKLVRKWPESRENLGVCSEIGPKIVRLPRKSYICDRFLRFDRKNSGKCPRFGADFATCQKPSCFGILWSIKWGGVRLAKNVPPDKRAYTRNRPNSDTPPEPVFGWIWALEPAVGQNSEVLRHFHGISLEKTRDLAQIGEFAR